MGRDKSFAWALLAILNGSLVLLCFDSLSLSLSLSPSLAVCQGKHPTQQSRRLGFEGSDTRDDPQKLCLAYTHHLDIFYPQTTQVNIVRHQFS